MDPEQNLKSFLDMIALSELGQDLLDASDNGYNVLVGSYPGHVLTFTGYDRHPHILNSKLDSTAAGRYQIIYPTWVSLQHKLALPDFDPQSQDTAAEELIRERGALDDVESGRIPEAIEKCAPEWASLAGSTSGQHQNSVQSLLAAYQSAGGQVA